MPTILAIDTATDACSAAVLADGSIAAHRMVEMTRGQAEALMPMVKEVLDQAGRSFAELTAVAVTVGPGAFTGLRIGLAAARGIGLAAGIPVIGATTLETIAAATPPDEREGASLAVAVESKRSDIYLQTFSATLAPLSEPASVMPEGLAATLPDGPILLAGTAAERAAAAIDDPDRVRLSRSGPHPDAGVLATIAAERLREIETSGMAVAPPEPLYLRPPDAKRPAGGGRLRP